MISKLIEEQMEQEQGYQRSMAEFLTREPEQIKNSSSSYPKREELYTKNSKTNT